MDGILSASQIQWIDLLSDWPDDLTKHYVFMCHCLRAGTTWECLRMAHAMRERPLPRHAMEHIARHWSDESVAA